MQTKFIISYDLGYTDWYVSEFYKYFHSRLVQENSNVVFEYLPLKELANKFNVEYNSNILFNWFNLVIFDPRTEKFFIHSWNDNAPMVLDECAQFDIDLVSFSCVTNVKNDDVIEKWKNKVTINPSVYCLANWSDHIFIKATAEKVNRKDQVFFNGLLHSHRAYVKETLSQNIFFEIKSKESSYKSGFDYFDEVSNYKFGLSLNGAAHICFRDLELFGMKVLNLRETFLSKTHNPIIKDIHYVEFINSEFFNSIITQETHKVKALLEEKVEQIQEFTNTPRYEEMLNEANKWFQENVLPENQFKIISSFLQEFTIFK